MFIETDRGHANLAHASRMAVVEGGMMLHGVGGPLGLTDQAKARAAALSLGWLANRAGTEFFNPAHIARAAREPMYPHFARLVTRFYGAGGEVLGEVPDPVDFERLTGMPEERADVV